MNEPYQNAGVVQNRGWDLELKHTNTVGKFSYQIGFTLSDVHNKILDLKGAGPIISGYNLKAEGYPINSIYGYKALGLFRTEEQLAESPKQTFSSYDLGDIRYTDLSDAGAANTIDREDRTVIGNQIPRFVYGLNISAQWRNFDLSVLIQGVGKKDVIYTGDVVWALYNAGKMQTWQTDYWSKENPDASLPAPDRGIVAQQLPEFEFLGLRRGLPAPEEPPGGLHSPGTPHAQNMDRQTARLFHGRQPADLGQNAQGLGPRDPPAATPRSTPSPRPSSSESNLPSNLKTP